jgi:predicted RNA-binding Zn-ribbon protein involved in translation (DUF1610 family)
MADEQLRKESNRLYWETDSPVAEIAETLGISRRALYEVIEPQPVGVPCPDCGAGLVFRNRTALERGRAECPECEFEMALEPDLDRDAAEPEVEQERAGARLSPMRGRTLTHHGSGAVLGGSLLAGIALGATLGFLFRQR